MFKLLLYFIVSLFVWHCASAPAAAGNADLGIDIQRDSLETSQSLRDAKRAYEDQKNATSKSPVGAPTIDKPISSSNVDHGSSHGAVQPHDNTTVEH